jgi:chromosome segregation ATPase
LILHLHLHLLILLHLLLHLKKKKIIFPIRFPIRGLARRLKMILKQTDFTEMRGFVDYLRDKIEEQEEVTNQLGERQGLLEETLETVSTDTDRVEDQVRAELLDKTQQVDRLEETTREQGESTTARLNRLDEWMKEEWKKDADLDVDLIRLAEKTNRLEEEVHELKVAAKTSWEEQQAQEKHLDILEETAREQGERIDTLLRICTIQQMLILGMLPLGKELERKMEFAISQEGMRLAENSIVEMIRNQNHGTGPKKTDG